MLIEELCMFVLELGNFILYKYCSILFNLFDLDVIIVDDVMMLCVWVELLDLLCLIEEVI